MKLTVVTAFVSFLLLISNSFAGNLDQLIETYSQMRQDLSLLEGLAAARCVTEDVRYDPVTKEGHTYQYLAVASCQHSVSRSFEKSLAAKIAKISSIDMRADLNGYLLQVKSTNSKVNLSATTWPVAPDAARKERDTFQESLAGLAGEMTRLVQTYQEIADQKKLELISAIENEFTSGAFQVEVSESLRLLFEQKEKLGQEIATHEQKKKDQAEGLKTQSQQLVKLDERLSFLRISVTGIEAEIIKVTEQKRDLILASEREGQTAEQQLKLKMETLNAQFELRKKELETQESQMIASLDKKKKEVQDFKTTYTNLMNSCLQESAKDSVKVSGIQGNDAALAKFQRHIVEQIQNEIDQYLQENQKKLVQNVEFTPKHQVSVRIQSVRKKTGFNSSDMYEATLVISVTAICLNHEESDSSRNLFISVIFDSNGKMKSNPDFLRLLYKFVHIDIPALKAKAMAFVNTPMNQQKLFEIAQKAQAICPVSNALYPVLEGAYRPNSAAPWPSAPPPEFVGVQGESSTSQEEGL